MCECTGWAGYGEQSFGQYHHINCPKYKTEKYPRLFYYEEGEGFWAPVPNKVDGNLIDTSCQLEDGEEMEVMFRRKDMTDYEFANLPEE